METVKLGNTGLDVSPICLGCMNFGTGEGWVHNDWALNEDDSRAVIQSALESGINFFDTANVYAYGTSEAFLGRAIRDFANRDEVVVATKVNGRMHAGPNGQGLSRKAIMSQIDHSLQRLGMDYVDLYIIHRWDPNTPIEETMAALHDVVRAGKARYIGASSMWAWQFLKALTVAERNGWTRFVSMQNHYNLIYREEEREMLPLCVEEGVAVTPWSPLAAGRLARDKTADTQRAATDATVSRKYDATEAGDQVVIERVIELAQKHGVTRAQIALAWMLHKDGVVSPVIGASKISHVEDAVAAASLSLSAEEIASLEDPYVPHPIVGHR